MLKKMKISLPLFILIWITYLIGSANAAEIPLVINELMASNDTIIRDPQGQYDDWIEIYNYGTDEIDLGGMYLTDNLSAPTKWQFPVSNSALTTIPAGGYLLVWVDDDTTDYGLHANFKLDAGGEEIGLYDSDGVTLIPTAGFQMPVNTGRPSVLPARKLKTSAFTMALSPISSSATNAAFMTSRFI
jgi:hypothetical protein